MSDSNDSTEQRGQQIERRGSAWGIKMVNVVSCANIADIDSIKSSKLLVDENELNAMRVFQESESSRSQNDASSGSQFYQNGQGHQKNSKQREQENAKDIHDNLSWQEESIKSNRKKGKEKINSEELESKVDLSKNPSRKLPSDDQIQRRPSNFEIDEKQEGNFDEDHIKVIDKIASMISGEEHNSEEDNHDVYVEMKENKIDRNHLINMLRNQDNPFSNEEDRKQHAQQIDDMKSQYTLQSINACNDFDFLILLMKNFGRGQNSEIMELALTKVQEKFSSIDSQVNDLRQKNVKILKQNSAYKEEIKNLKLDLKQADFDKERLKKALHTRVSVHNSEIQKQSSGCFDSNAGMSLKLTKKEVDDRKRSIENFKRINTMGHFEMQKNNIDENSMEIQKPKPKKKKSNNIPLSYAKPKEIKADIPKINQIKPKTLGKVRENSPGVEFIKESFIRSSRDNIIDPMISQKSQTGDDINCNQILPTLFPTERLSLGPQISNTAGILSKRNHCYRPLQSFSKIEESKYDNSYFDKTDGQFVNSTMSERNRIPINFNLTQQPKVDSDTEDEQTIFDMGNNSAAANNQMSFNQQQR